MFWTQVLHAVERAVPEAAASAIAQLESGRCRSTRSLLINELGVTAADLSLVLNDHHLAVQAGMSFLLEHLGRSCTW